MAAAEALVAPMRHPTAHNALSLAAVGLICAAFGWLLPLVAYPTPLILLVFAGCSAAFFATFRYPLAYQPGRGLFDNLAALACHIALGLGFAFLFEMAYGVAGFPRLGRIYRDSPFTSLLLLIVTPAAVAFFVRFFFETVLRIGLSNLWIRIVGSIALAVLTIAAAALPFVPSQGNQAEIGGLLCCTIVLFTAFLLGVMSSAAVARQMMLRKILVDLFVTGGFIFLYFAGAHWLLSGGGLTGLQRDTRQFFLFVLFLVVFGAIDLVFQYRRRKAVAAATSNANDDNPSLIAFVLRTMGGIAANFTVILSPLATLFYGATTNFFAYRFGGRYALSAEAAKLAQHCGRASGWCYLLMLPAPFVVWLVTRDNPAARLAPFVGAASLADAVIFALAGLSAWSALRRLSVHFENHRSAS